LAGESAEILFTVTRPAPKSGAVPVSMGFGPGGGTVGRAAQCDLILPDETNLVSRRHFEVVYRDGAFEAVDLSANGLFLNGAAEPVGNGNAARLKQGDRLGVGDYELTVERLTTGGAAGDFPEAERSFHGNPFASGGAGAAATPPPGDRRAEEPPAPPERDAGRDPFGLPEGLARDPFDLLEENESSDWPRSAGRSPVAPSIGAEADDPEADTPLIPDDYDPLADLDLPAGEGAEPDHTPGWNMPLSDVMKPAAKPAAQAPDPEPAPEPEPEPRPEAAPARASAPAPSARPEPAPGDAGEAMAAFWQAAGIDPARLSGNEGGPEHAGRLFGVMVRGLWEMLRARMAFKEEFRVERTMLGAADNNPLKFAIDEAQAIEGLARPASRGFMAPERAVEEAFDDIRTHEMALVAAMHRALAHVLEEFDPEGLESRLEGMSLLDALPGGRRARYWDLYLKHYTEIARKAEDIFEGALGREFVTAYERASRRDRTGGEE